MAISTQTQNLNLIPGKSAPVVVHCSQGNVGDTVQFYLYDGDDPFYPTNVSIAVHGVRADGSVFGPYAVAVTSGSNLVSFELVTAMTSVNGAAIGELVISDSGENQVGSANFGILVEATPYSSSVTYEDDLSIYQRILAYVQSIPAELSGEIAAVQAALNTEISDREAGDTTVKNSVDSEIANREAGDTAIENKLNAEISNRQSGDNNLQSQINQYVTPSSEQPTEVVNARIKADGFENLSTLKSRLDSDSAVSNGIIETEKLFEDSGTLTLLRGRFDIGSMNPSTGAISNFKYRISSRVPLVFSQDITLNIKSGFRIFVYKYNGSSWDNVGWQTGTYVLERNTQYHMQICRVTENTSEIADVAEFVSAVTFSDYGYASDIKTLAQYGSDMASSSSYRIPLENGAWVATNGKLVKVASPSSSDVRYRTPLLISVPQCIRIELLDPSVKVAVFAGDSNGNYLGTYTHIYGPVNVSQTINVPNSDYDGAERICITVILDGTTTRPASLEKYVKLYVVGSPIVANGKQVLVYEYGDLYNDYCFVRTPANYNQGRNIPYPFVICNHGNGWTMNGTVEMANWTKRTMYVPTTDPDYIADPTQYNGTSDSSLWYSNPTIEALLDAGYVVCGAENAADGLYGNNKCRNACVNFFYHMINTYNVEKRCCMIGASNGALTALNAAYLLQGAVKSMILQYPLTCLVNQYENYEPHRAAIREAYGIADESISIEALASAVRTHDPLTVDVVDGKKVGAFPPTKMYYSKQDTVVNYQVNTMALANLLEASGKVVETVECTGGHGDASHFNPSEYVAWFNAN